MQRSWPEDYDPAHSGGGNRRMVIAVSLEAGGAGAKDAEIRWVFGDVVNERGHKDQMWWLPRPSFGENASPQVITEGGVPVGLRINASSDPWKASLAEIQLRTLEFFAGSRWKSQNVMRVSAAGLADGWKPSSDGNLIACSAPLSSGWKGIMTVVWGGDPNEANLSRWENDMKALGLAWCDELFREWRENYVYRGSQPRPTFEHVLRSPQQALDDSSEFWTRIRRRSVFEMPDRKFRLGPTGW